MLDQSIYHRKKKTYIYIYMYLVTILLASHVNLKYHMQHFTKCDRLPVPIIYIFGVSSLFYDPPRITFTPFSHFYLKRKQQKPTRPVYSQNLPGFFSAQLRQGVSFRFAQCIMDESCPAALVPQHVVIQSDSVVIKRLRSRNTHTSSWLRRTEYVM